MAMDKQPRSRCCDGGTGVKPTNPARYAFVRKDAPGRTRRAPAAARADETRTQEHQGYHLDRLLRRGAGRLLERARLLQVRRAVGQLPDAFFCDAGGGRGLMGRMREERLAAVYR